MRVLSEVYEKSVWGWEAPCESLFLSSESLFMGLSDEM